MPPFSLSTATPQWLAVCAIALAGWGVAAGAAVRWWRSGAGEPRPAGDLALAALLAATTASLGALVPDGPLSFSGVARLPEAWATQPDSILAFMGLRAPLVAMRTLGLSPTAATHLFTRAAAVADVVGVFAVARASGLARPYAVLAALVVCLWPAHLRFAVELGETLPTAALLTWLALPVVASRREDGAPEGFGALAAALALLASISRPETPAFVALLAIAAAPRTRRSVIAGLTLGVVVRGAASALTVGAPQHAAVTIGRVLSNARSAQFGLLESSIAPWPWYVVALAGVLIGSAVPRPLRAAWSAAAAGLLVAFPVFGYEYNPVWGQSRYYLLLLPMTALLAVAALSRLDASAKRPFALTAGAVALVGYTAYALPLLTLPMDLQVERAFIAASAPPPGGIVIAYDGGCDTERHFPAESLVAAALSAGAPARLDYCELALAADQYTVLPLSHVLRYCPATLSRPDVLVYRGGYAPTGCDDALYAAGGLEEVVGADLVAHAVSPISTTACRDGAWDYVGRAHRACQYRVGWYRTVVRFVPTETPG